MMEKHIEMVDSLKVSTWWSSFYCGLYKGLRVVDNPACKIFALKISPVIFHVVDNLLHAVDNHCPRRGVENDFLMA